MRLLLSLVVIASFLFLIGCSLGSPLADTVYFTDLYLYGQVTLVEDGKVYFELRPDLDFETVRANGKPTQVARGIIHGWSLPVYSADSEELFFEMHVPDRWDNASDILVHVHCYLDTANTNRNFNLQVSWENFTDGDVIPATSHDLTVETATGTAVQYQSYHISYTVDYDIVPADAVASSDELHLRLRRLAASANETAGEVVITHVGLVFLRDKLGSPTP